LPHFSGVIYEAIPENKTCGEKVGSTTRIKRREGAYRKECDWFGKGKLVPIRTVEGEYADKEQFLAHLKVAEFFEITRRNYFTVGRNKSNPIMEIFWGDGYRWSGGNSPVRQIPEHFYRFKCEHEGVLPAQGLSNDVAFWQKLKSLRGGCFVCKRCYPRGARCIGRPRSSFFCTIKNSKRARITELESMIDGLYRLCCWESESQRLTLPRVFGYSVEYKRRIHQIETVKQELFALSDSVSPAFGERVRRKHSYVSDTTTLEERLIASFQQYRRPMTAAATLDARNRVPARLANLGMSHSAFCELCGVHKVEFSRMLNGSRPLLASQSQDFDDLLTQLEEMSRLFHPLKPQFTDVNTVREWLNAPTMPNIFQLLGNVRVGPSLPNWDEERAAWIDMLGAR
jgi:hypothetical protein